jgi:hypothetical protein
MKLRTAFHLNPRHSIRRLREGTDIAMSIVTSFAVFFIDEPLGNPRVEPFPEFSVPGDRGRSRSGNPHRSPSWRATAQCRLAIRADLWLPAFRFLRTCSTFPPCYARPLPIRGGNGDSVGGAQNPGLRGRGECQAPMIRSLRVISPSKLKQPNLKTI